jgi:hypothetical protein
MTKRLIATITGTVRTVKVYRDAEWNEYTCVPQDASRTDREARTYHTDDKQDALNTARVMADEGTN